MRRGFVLCLLLAASVGWSAAAFGQEAATVTRVGWWTRNPAASAPQDGIDVGAAADGSPNSLGAFEVSTTGRVSRAVVILIESSGVQQEGAQLQVCSTPNTWKAGGGQPLADAPKAECDRGKATLTRNAASTSWAADVTTLMTDEVITLMVVPAGAGAVPVGFDVAFARPQIQAELAPDSESISGPPTDFGSSSADGFSAPSTPSAPGTNSFGAPEPTFEPPPFTVADAPAASLDTATMSPPVSPDVVLPDSPNSGELAALPTPVQAARTGNHALQAAFFVAVALLAGTAAGAGRWWLRRREEATA